MKIEYKATQAKHRYDDSTVYRFDLYKDGKWDWCIDCEKPEPTEETLRYVKGRYGQDTELISL